MEEIPIKDIRITGGFWSERLRVNARRAIFHQWEQLEASGCIDNFRIAAGELATLAATSIAWNEGSSHNEIALCSGLPGQIHLPSPLTFPPTVCYTSVR